MIATASLPVFPHPNQTSRCLPTIGDGIATLTERFPLTHGGEIEQPRLAWEIAGPLDAPVVLVLGGISADRHVTSAGIGSHPGWWEKIAGPGRAIDTNRFRVLSFDYLGGNGRSTGPRSGETIERLDTRDQAHALQLLLRKLGIEKLHAVVGASYGGMVALAIAEEYPELVDRICVVSAADRPHPQSTALRAIQRRIVRHCKSCGDIAEGLNLARSLAMVTYRSRDEFEQRFSGPPRIDEDGVPHFPIEDYLDARGGDFARKFNVDAFLSLSESIDLQCVEPDRVEVPVTLLGVTSDQLVPITVIRKLANNLPCCDFHEIDSLYGHDAFLKEDKTVGRIINDCLETDQ